MTPRDGDPVDPGDPGDPVGSVGDEAAKLLGALAEWAGDHLGDRVREVTDHLATGDSECLYCPVCRTVHAVRQASPEVKAQLASAASAFLQAAAGIMADAGSGARPSSRVEHIDLDDPEEPEDPEDPEDPEEAGR